MPDLPDGVTLGIIVLVVLILIVVRQSLNIVKEYERAVIFRLGKVQGGARGPGVFFIIPIVDAIQKVNLQTVTMDIPPQDIITKDNVTVRVNAVCYFKVLDPVAATIEVENYRYATSQIAQTTLRSIIGQVDLDELLVERESINDRLQEIIDSVTDPWGVKVTLVEVKDVELPETMRRAMARQAEAERDRRAKVIHAMGEQEAAENLSQAAQMLDQHPSALQLRLLSTMTEISAEKNSTLIFPVPVEMLRFFDAKAAEAGYGSTADVPPVKGTPTTRPIQKSPPVPPEEPPDDAGPELSAP